jgi:GAF domain-containing protein
LADQVAVAIQNTRSFQQAQLALQELEMTNRLLTSQGWQEYLQRQSAIRQVELGVAGASAVTAEAPSEPLSISLELRGRSIGKLSVHRESGNPWSDDEVELIRAIALQTALAADNVRLVEQTQQALEEARALYQTSREITSAGEISEVLTAVMDNLSRTGVHTAAVALFDTATREQARYIELAGAWDHKGTPRLPPGTRFAIADFPLFNRITRDKALISEDLLTDPGIDDFARATLGGLGLRAMTATPLVARGQWIGVMLALIEQPHTFTSAELSFQRALADQAAVAIDNRRLLAETQRRAERERLIRQITTRIRAANDLQSVLQTTAAELAQSLRVPRAIVRLTMGDGANEA